MAKDRGGDALDEVALLAEPARRRLYDYVVRAGRDIGRDEVARALGIDRELAAFHLDKLVVAGFLEVSFRRLSDRTGPGAGRPSKLYRRSAKRLEVSMPPTRYEMLARMLARAIAAAGGAATRELTEAAREVGRVLGAEARRSAGRGRSGESLLRAAERTLTQNGYEPRREASGVLRLANCPFDAISNEQTDLVCGMNHELLTSFVDELGAPGLSAIADRRPGVCCVALQFADRAGSSRARRQSRSRSSTAE